MKIIQLLPTMSFGDAVSNDTLAIRQMIREMGIETENYAENIDNRLPAGSVKPMRHVGAAARRAEGDAVSQHHAAGVLPGI